MNNKENALRKENIIIVFFLLCISLLYPGSFTGFSAYIPQIILGFVALYVIFKIPIIKPAKSLFIFASYMTIMSFILSIMNVSGGMLDIFRSSLRLYYPFIGLIIGGMFLRKVSPKSLLYILIFFLTLQFVTSCLQINNEAFRIWSYNLYKAKNVSYYLESFVWSTGKRAIGTVGNPNLLGMLTVVLNSTILIIASLVTRKRLQKIINIICIAASIYICIYTQSRTAVMLLVFSTALIIYWQFPRKGIEKLIYLIIPGIGAMLLFSFIQAEISREISLSALDSRFNIWQLRISQMFDYAKYENFYTGILGVGFHTARGFGFFDNTFVKIFVSGGIIGLIVFLRPIIDVIKALLKKPKAELRYLGLMLTLLWVFGSMVSDYQEVFKLSMTTFILMGYALYSGELDKRTKKDH